MAVDAVFKICERAEDDEDVQRRKGGVFKPELKRRKREIRREVCEKNEKERGRRFLFREEEKKIRERDGDEGVDNPPCETEHPRRRREKRLRDALVIGLVVHCLIIPNLKKIEVLKKWVVAD